MPLDAELTATEARFKTLSGDPYVLKCPNEQNTKDFLALLDKAPILFIGPHLVVREVDIHAT
jgi:hypothetical protein